MYPINTILTFTSLTHASAAADLFGKYSIQSLLEYTHWKQEPEWLDGFCCKVELDEPRAQFYTLNKWRIILDAPEKVKWFEPQVGDFVQDFDIGGLVTKIRDRGVDYETYHETNFNYFDKVKILLRDGHPFPQPQGVKLGE
jgi:hypothetical protein